MSWCRFHSWWLLPCRRSEHHSRFRLGWKCSERNRSVCLRRRLASLIWPHLVCTAGSLRVLLPGQAFPNNGSTSKAIIRHYVTCIYTLVFGPSSYLQSELSGSHVKIFYRAIIWAMSMWKTAFAHRSNLIHASWANWASFPRKIFAWEYFLEPSSTVGMQWVHSMWLWHCEKERKSRYKVEASYLMGFRTLPSCYHPFYKSGFCSCCGWSFFPMFWGWRGIPDVIHSFVSMLHFTTTTGSLVCNLFWFCS